MKKLTAFLLALALMLSLTACGNEPEARKTMEGFLNAYVQMDLEGMKAFVQDESVIPEEVNLRNIDPIMETLPLELNDYRDELQQIFQMLPEKAKACFAYEIKGVKKAENQYVYTVQLTAPQKKSLNASDILRDQLNEEVMRQIYLELANSGTLTPSSTEQDIQNELIPRIPGILRASMENLQMETVERVEEFTVAQVDGQWLIVK